ncbi:MAG TPA: beta-N-acetylglucosaminidase domain-containing protein [Caulobacteraceae bacterium]
MTPPLGIIEGYYGRPWSWDMREEQARFFAGHGHSSYIYAPKADKRLRKQWRDDHPQDAADRLARMAKLCAELGMGFGVGLSPYEAYRDFGEETRAALARKVAFFDDLGCTELAILFDDMKGDQSDLAAVQVRMAHFVAEHSKAKRLIVCPTVYTDDAMLVRAYGPFPPAYLDELGASLDPKFEIYWTGEEVCSREYSPGHLEQVGERLRRKPTLWDNYPVNDGPGMSPFLYLRAFTGRPASIGPQIASHMVNPCLQPVLFRIPALTLAESYAKGDAYEYLRAWDRAAEAVLGAELADVLRRHYRLFHDQGLGRIDEQTPRIRERWSAFDHPAAHEVLAWLDGHWTVTREMMEADA